jgi:hypothetical protein
MSGAVGQKIRAKGLREPTATLKSLRPKCRAFPFIDPASDEARTGRIRRSRETSYELFVRWLLLRSVVGRLLAVGLQEVHPFLRRASVTI